MDSLNLGKPNLEVFAESLISLAQKDPDVLAVTCDSRGSGKLTSYGQKLPAQIVEVGIAEQNLVGIAAGLTSGGKKAFAVSPACFLTARALEQIKNDVAYSDLPVKLIGISAGVSYGALGSTHHSLHDYAVLQAIDNITIVAPADNFETRAVMEAALTYDRPLYVRFGKKAVYDLHAPGSKFNIGKAITIREGKDVAFIACGETVARALLAAHLLEAKGIAAGVISMHTIRPLDKETLLAAAAGVQALVTVEEHSVNGGLGSAVASLLANEGLCTPLRIVGIPDEPTVPGSQDEIFEHYGITPSGLADTACSLLGRKRIYQRPAVD